MCDKMARKIRLDSFLLDISMSALVKKSNGNKIIPISQARKSVIFVRFNKSIANEILEQLAKDGKIKKNQQFIRLLFK